MSESTPFIFNPVTEVKLRDGKTVEVRELSWPDALAFYNKLRAQSKALLNEKGDLVLDANKLLDVIGENVELAAWLVEKTTGQDADWIAQRSLSEMLEIITVALEVNLEVITEKIKNGKCRLQALAGGEATNK